MLLRRLKNLIKSWPLPKFARCGSKVIISRPRFVLNPERIEIGSDTYLGKDSTLIALRDGDSNQWGKILIGNRVWATSRISVFAVKSVIIEDNVLIASNVFISDYSHGHLTAEIPYKEQSYSDIAPVIIGEGSWLGQNSVIMPGVTIGRRVIVGANAVVTRSVPAGAVVAGAPARIIKQWDWDAKVWRKPS